MKMDNTNHNEHNKVDPTSVFHNVKSNFKQEAIKQVVMESFEDNKTKLSSDAVQLVSEIAKSLCNEACLRAATRAIHDGSDNIDIEHLEKILPQLMLDFP